LALLLASVIGVHSHAFTHSHQATGHAQHAHAGDSNAALPAPVSHQHSHDHGSPGSGHDHSTCLDLVCHGGIAILAGDTSVAAFARESFRLEAARILYSTAPGCLDRPPRPSFHA
jgi:hypothetical protein